MTKKTKKEGQKPTPIHWKAFFAEVTSEGLADERALELEKSVALQLHETLSGFDPRLFGAHQVFAAISAADLNQAISQLDVDSSSSQRALVSLSNVIHMAPAAAAALVQHGLVEALVNGLHKRIGRSVMTHELTHLSVMVLWSVLIKVEEVYGPQGADLMAQKPALLELLIGIIMYMSTTPEQLFTQLGLVTATRAVRIMWGLVRHDTPSARSALALCKSIDLAGRVVELSALYPTDVQMPDPSGPGGAGPGGSYGELYMGLLSVSTSFTSTMLGLGGVLDLRAVALRPLRLWLLTPGRLATLAKPMQCLIDELHGHGRFLQHLKGEEGAPMPERLAGMQKQVDGALRNLLTALAVPLMCAAGSPGMDMAAEASSLVEFALKYHHALFQEGYLDIFKRLADSSSPYRGDYLAFFAAFSGVMQEGTLDIGSKFYEWGVRFGKKKEEEPAAGDAASLAPASAEDGAEAADAGASSGGGAEIDLPEGSGVSAEEAQEFIRSRVVPITERAGKLRKVIELGQRSMLASRVLPNVAAGGPSADLDSVTAALLKANLSGGHTQLEGASMAPTGSACSFCGVTEGAHGGPMRSCPCKLAAYCSKTCQLAHFPEHKGVCSVVQAKRQQTKAKEPAAV